MKKELKEKIENIEISYDYEDTYSKLYNACIDYMNETQDFELEYLFADFVDCDLAEEMAKNELENGGLARLFYFMGDCNFNAYNLFKVNGYGNLEVVTKDDLELLKEEILDNIKE